MKSKELLKNISKTLSEKNFRYVELDTVIPLDYINKKTSDNFRNSMFTFMNKTNEFALRSDLSVMSLLKYVENGSQKKEKWWYQGEVFRRNEDSEKPFYNQIGFEILGSNNQERDDEEILNSAINIVNKLNLKSAEVVIGNVNIFREFLYKIKNLPKRWASLLLRAHSNSAYFKELLYRLESSNDLLDESTINYDTKLYKKLKKINQNQIIGRRKIRDIIRRFEEKKILDPRLPGEGKKISLLIKKFLKISNAPLNKVKNRLNNFFKENNIKIDINYLFPKSLEKKNSIKTNFKIFETLDYYDGLIFKIIAKKGNSKRVICSGGRLKTSLMKKNVSICGAAIDLKNL